jgi:hypothetical protein
LLSSLQQFSTYFHSRVFDRRRISCDHIKSGRNWSNKLEGGMLMSVEAHLESLLRKHGVLETEISQIMSRPVPDQAELTQLKREKLRLKEEIERLRSETRH